MDKDRQNKINDAVAKSVQDRYREIKATGTVPWDSRHPGAVGLTVKQTGHGEYEVRGATSMVMNKRPEDQPHQPAPIAVHHQDRVTTTRNAGGEIRDNGMHQEEVSASQMAHDAEYAGTPLNMYGVRKSMYTIPKLDREPEMTKPCKNCQKVNVYEGSGDINPNALDTKAQIKAKEAKAARRQGSGRSRSRGSRGRRGRSRGGQSASTSQDRGLSTDEFEYANGISPSPPRLETESGDE